jgi:hypothetical protein
LGYRQQDNQTSSISLIACVINKLINCDGVEPRRID